MRTVKAQTRMPGCRPGCASAQSDQRHCFSLNGNFNGLVCYVPSFDTLASVCSWTCTFKHSLVANPDNRFSRDEANFIQSCFDVSNLNPNAPIYKFLHSMVQTNILLILCNLKLTHSKKLFDVQQGMSTGMLKQV